MRFTFTLFVLPAFSGSGMSMLPSGTGSISNLTRNFGSSSVYALNSPFAGGFCGPAVAAGGVIMTASAPSSRAALVSFWIGLNIMRRCILKTGCWVLGVGCWVSGDSVVGSSGRWALNPQSAIRNPQSRSSDSLARYKYTQVHMGVQVSVTLYAPSQAAAEFAATAAFKRFVELEDI